MVKPKKTDGLGHEFRRRGRPRKQPSSDSTRKSSIQKIDQVLRSLQAIAGLSIEQEIVSEGGSGGSETGPQQDTISEQERALLAQQLVETRHELTSAFRKAAELKSRILALDSSFEFQNTIGDLRYRIFECEALLRDERARRREAEQVLADVHRECQDPVIIPQMFKGLGAAVVDNFSCHD